VSAVEFGGQCGQFGLGGQRGIGVVGLAHPGSHDRAHLLGEPVFDIADLVELAATEHGAVEDIQHRPAQRFGSIEHHQDGAGDIQAALAQPNDQLGDQGGVLGRALDQRQRVFGAVDADSQGDHAGVLTEVHPVDHQPDQVQRRQVRGQQLGQRGLGRGDEPARDGRLRRGCGGLLDARAHRFKPHRVAPRRQPGQHPLHRHPAQHLRLGKQLIRRHRQFPRAIGRARPRPAYGYPASTQAHRPRTVPMPRRRALGIMAALGPAHRGHIGFHHRGHHLQPGAHSQRQ